MIIVFDVFNCVYLMYAALDNFVTIFRRCKSSIVIC